jgi:hypothetical protein
LIAPPVLATQAGLTRVLSDVPYREGYLEAIAGWGSLSGPVVRGEAGARLTPRFGVFGFGEWTPRETMAGVGARVTWGW